MNDPAVIPSPLWPVHLLNALSENTTLGHVEVAKALTCDDLSRVGLEGDDPREEQNRPYLLGRHARPGHDRPYANILPSYFKKVEMHRRGILKARIPCCGRLPVDWTTKKWYREAENVLSRVLPPRVIDGSKLSEILTRFFSIRSEPQLTDFYLPGEEPDTLEYLMSPLREDVMSPLYEEEYWFRPDHGWGRYRPTSSAGQAHLGHRCAAVFESA